MKEVRLFTAQGAVLVLSALFVLAPGQALGADSPEESLAAATDLVKADKGAEAAHHLAKAIRYAHKRHDLTLESRAAAILHRALVQDAAVPDRPFGGTPSDATRRQAVLAATLAGIDARHRGCIVSAETISRVLLFHAVLSRSDVGVDSAVAAMKRHRRNERSGIAREALALFAMGVQAGLANKGKKCIAALRKALPLAQTNGWPHLAVHICTELAAAYASAGDLKRATAAVDSTVAALDAAVQSQAAMRWIGLARVRWTGPAEGLLARLQVLEKRAARYSKIAVAEEVAALNRGAKELAELQRSWDRLGAKVVFALVRRQETTMMGSSALGKGRLEQFWNFDGGVRHAHYNGVVFSYRMNAAGLRGIDLEGRLAVPAGYHLESGAYGLYLLAPGEYVKFTRSGALQLSG